MRAWEGSLASHYQLETTTIATCFRITLLRHQFPIASITQSDVSAEVHTKYENTLQTGEVFRMVDVAGMTEVNGAYFVVGTAVTSTAFNLHRYTANGSVINASTSAYTAYASGGTVQKTYGLTNVDVDVYSSGVRYYADVGYLPQDIRHLTNMDISNSEVQTAYSSAININKDDILFGRWDDAEYEIFEVNYENVAQGKLILGFGHLGDVNIDRNVFTAEFKSISDKLKAENMRVVTKDCPYVVGDSNCQADIASALVSGTVASTTSRTVFVDTTRGEGDKWFTNGIFTFTNGENAGVSYEIKSYSSGGTFEFYDAVLYAVTSGTAYEATPGCDKSSQGSQGCINKWNNIVNFGGFDFVTGSRAVTEHGTYGA